MHYGLCENGEYLKDTLQFRFWGLLLVSRIERDEHRNEVAYSVFIMVIELSGVQFGLKSYA